LNTPASPHAAAKLDGVKIELEKFKIPETKSDLVIEGAGGCLVPLNDHDFVISLAKKFNAEVILVSQLYLGSINHTLLSADYLTRHEFKVKGVIFNGLSNPESENIILKHTRFPCLLRIEQEPVISKAIVVKYAKELNRNW